MSWFSRHLSIRETTYALAVVALLTLAVGSLEVFLAYKSEKQHLTSTMNQMFESVADTSARAAYHVDERQADAVLDGLMKFNSLESAQISTELGVVLAKRVRRVEDSISDSFATWLFGDLARQQRVLVFDRLLSDSIIARDDTGIDPDKIVGTIELTASSEVLGSSFIMLMTDLMIALLLEMLLVAAALAYIFHRSLTRPLLQLADDLENIDPRGTVMTRVSLPAGHEQDELGLVVGRTNDLLREIFGLYESEALNRRYLEESELRFRSIFDNAAVGIVEVGTNNQIERCNRQMARMLGHDEDQFTGSGIDSLIHSEDLDIDKQLRNSLIADEIPTYVVPKRFIRADGSIMYGSVTVSVAREPDQTENLILVVQDITHSKEQEAKIADQHEALMHRERIAALGSMLAGVAHELNNPLAVVMAQTELLVETANDQKTRERAQKILKPVERCSRIIRTFLALARHRDTRKSSISVIDLIGDVRELLEYQFRTNAIEVTINVEPDFPEIWGDGAQISQVLLNLLVNSQQALMEVDRNRSIAIEALRGKQNRIRIKVSDNGPGIPESIRKRVFEPFFTTKPEGQGTGLGLSFCQNVAEGHGGTITIDSENSGGTGITFELPVGEARPIDSEQEKTATDKLEDSLRILVVDDEVSLLESIVEQLIWLGYSAQGCPDAKVALELIANEVFDIIVTDIRMPGIDGPTFFEAVSSEKPSLRDRFIFITGDSLSQNASSFIESSTAPCLKKPFKIIDLNRTINEVARGNKAGIVGDEPGDGGDSNAKARQAGLG